MERRGRRRALLFAVALCMAVVWPAVTTLLGDDSDGFPLSNYPMFTNDPGRIVDVPTVVAIADDGTVRQLSPRLIAGSDQVIQAAETVRLAIREGSAALAALCAEVAGRLDEPWTVAVVVERHDSVAWSAGEREPLDRRVLTECEEPTA